MRFSPSILVLFAAILPCPALACSICGTMSKRVSLAQEFLQADAVAYGHDLYAALRDLDASGCRRILVETPPATSDWSAITDRLGRAAVGSGEDDET